MEDEVKTIAPLLIALALFIGSEALLIHYGYVEIYLVLFVPVFVSSSLLALFPLLFFLIPLAFILFPRKDEHGFQRMEYRISESEEPVQKTESGIGGIVMIGPIPIIFGKGVSSKLLIALAVIATLLIIIWLILAK